MKGFKIFVVIILFGIAIFMVFGLKKRIVQNTCKQMGDYKATKGEDLSDASDLEAWYCCPEGQNKNTTNCLYYGD
jgi:hypothetical protein